MKKKYVLRLLAGTLITISSIIANPISANAEWIQDSKGSRYFNGNSYYTWWKQIDGKWYYFSPDGYMQTGWTEYMNKDSNENIVGSTFYYLGDDGSIDESKTTNVRPTEIQNMYDKIALFQPDVKSNLEYLCFNNKIKNLPIDVINKIKPNFGECYEFTTMSKYGDGINGIYYNNDTGSLLILNQGNYFITDTNETYCSLIEKSNYVNVIRQWVVRQNDYSNSIFNLKEEKDRFIIDKYSYNYMNNEVKFSKSYVYDKTLGTIK